MGAHHCEIQRWSFGCLKTLKSIKVEESKDLATHVTGNCNFWQKNASWATQRRKNQRKAKQFLGGKTMNIRMTRIQGEHDI